MIQADSNRPGSIKAVLLDLDGVLYVGDAMIDGADRVVNQLREQKLEIAGLTNTTTQSRRMIADKLLSLGIALAANELFTPASLAVHAIAGRSARLYIRDALHEDFVGVRQDTAHPEVIVMGDIGGEGYPPETLREIFLHVMGGAEILALHKNRFWQKPDGLHLDLGTFVSAIEYATGKQATILGKPSVDFFHGVCLALHTPPEQTLMIGDDIESDILGAYVAGLQAALVHTGKYRQDFAQRIMREHHFRPQFELPSIADLLNQLTD
jgi:HAD superfamily hydrolase (TIGR01458 family)